MFVSKKRWKELEKRVTDLEIQAQSQPKKIIDYINKVTESIGTSPLKL